MNYRTLMIAASGLAICALAAACGTDPGTRALTGGAMGAAAGAVIGNNVGDGDAGKGAIIGGVAGAIGGAVTAPSQQPTVNKRQYYDQRSGRYYFTDPATGRLYYENGQPYP
jgi:uncharacterized protein YcfJ